MISTRRLNIYVDRYITRSIDIKTDRQTDIQIDIYRNLQTGSQTNIEKHHPINRDKTIQNRTDRRHALEIPGGSTHSVPRHSHQEEIHGRTARVYGQAEPIPRDIKRSDPTAIQ